MNAFIVLLRMCGCHVASVRHDGITKVLLEDRDYYFIILRCEEDILLCQIIR